MIAVHKKKSIKNKKVVFRFTESKGLSAYSGKIPPPKKLEEVKKILQSIHTA